MGYTTLDSCTKSVFEIAISLLFEMGQLIVWTFLILPTLGSLVGGEEPWNYFTNPSKQSPFPYEFLTTSTKQPFPYQYTTTTTKRYGHYQVSRPNSPR